MKTTFGNIVRCYDAERTVCDLLRSRSRIDEETVLFVRTEKKIGRNDPCPCGSGKKYKKCCGKN